ncbi:MAG: cytochrome c3 family protein, partial [Bacteroidales bacterium]|nr:cytochrome c3 family protein [Bacteroidales bacterium]
ADANESCTQCHNENTTLKAKMVQFAESTHALGTYYTRGGECAACHSNEGFLARMSYSSLSELSTFVAEENTPISCYTCHNIHANGDASDLSLTFTAQVTGSILGFTSPDISQTTFPNYGDGNLCLQCHQSRDRGNIPGLESTADVTLNGHWGPHYGAQGEILVSAGAVEFGTGYPAIGSGHGAISDACISCHMVNGDHRMTVDYDACVTCHTAGDAEDKTDAIQIEIHDQLFTLGAALEGLGAMEAEYDTDGVTVIGYSPLGVTVSADIAKLVWNYELVYSDHSLGVHNPTYVRAILTNSLAQLAK